MLFQQCKFSKLNFLMSVTHVILKSKDANLHGVNGMLNQVNFSFIEIGP